MSDPERLKKQLDFILEIDKLKSIYRQSLLTDQSRRENSAEHSWHLAIMAMLLAEYAPGRVDITRVMKMLLVHDLVEIDAGDTYAYDSVNGATQHAREQQAAERIFSMLPDEQGREVRELWDEFEERRTTESRYANALDRLQPLMLNYHSQGLQWRKHGVSREQVIDRMRAVEVGMPEVWPTVMELIDEACRRGYIGGPVPAAD